MQVSSEYVSETARVWMGDDGIVRIVSSGARSTGESVEKTFAAIAEITGGKPVPILFDARRWTSGDPSSWSAFIGAVGDLCLAGAILVTDPDQPIGSFPHVINTLMVPMRVFTDADEAVEFLSLHE